MKYLASRAIRFFVVLLFLGILISGQKSFADPTPSPTPTATVTPTPSADNSQAVSDLNSKIHELEGKVADLQSQEKSLSSQISVMDNQIKLTQYRIESVKGQIAGLTEDINTASQKINNLEASMTNITKAMISRITATYQLGAVQPIQLLLSSKSFTDFIDRTNYIRIVQAHDKKLVYNTVQAKNDYANQRDIFEDKKKHVLALQTQLEDYTDQLDQEKGNKEKLLSETQGSEANYQRLLSQARAQLAGFSRFAQSQGGASLLGGQTVCDDWGCYYNQRDSQWGGNSLNGTEFSLASDGCLVTSMAMIYTHYGHRSVTPQTINGNPGNFASYYPAWLLKSIVADGASSSRVTAAIDSTLSGGDPVIVGISYDGGPLADHFVVFRSGSGGSYMMNDPFTPNGNNISFRDRYPNVRIVEVEKVVF